MDLSHACFQFDLVRSGEPGSVIDSVWSESPPYEQAKCPLGGGCHPQVIKRGHVYADIDAEVAPSVCTLLEQNSVNPLAPIARKRDATQLLEL